MHAHHHSIAPSAVPAVSCQGQALRAVILLRLDARAGEWVSVADLAAHAACSPQVIRTQLEHLQAAHHIAVQRQPFPGDAPGIPTALSGGLIEFARSA